MSLAFKKENPNSLLRLGTFNNYVDKMRGGEGVKKYPFLSTLRVKKLSTQGTLHAGGGGQKMTKSCPRSC